MNRIIRKRITALVCAISFLFTNTLMTREVFAEWVVLNPVSVSISEDRTYMIERYYPELLYRVNLNGMVGRKGIPLNLKGAQSISFGKPKVIGCAYCQAECDAHNAYRTSISIEKSNGTVISGSGYQLENLDGDFDYGYLYLQIAHEPGNECPYCGTRIGWVISVDTLDIKKRVITFIDHPSSISATVGSTGVMYVNAIYDGPYKWVRKTNGQWTEISDGAGPYGEVYSGSDTSKLTISKIPAGLNNQEYACRLVGARNYPAYSKSAFVYIPVVTQAPTSVPTQIPTQPPTVVPTQTPTQPPAQDPTPTPIRPSPGSGTDYRPQTSSSSHVSLSPVDGGTPQSPASTSSSSSKTNEKNDTYNGDITVNIPSSTTGQKPSIISTIPPSSSSGSKGSGTGKNGSSSGTASGEKESVSRSSTTRFNGKKSVMKDGVLYILDDDTSGGVITPSSATERGETVENTDEEMQYAASDLAMEGQIYDREVEKGFLETWQGIALMIAIALLLLLLALFFLFFGVLVFGEAEEHDEVFELCSVRLMRWKDGKWCVNLANAFDENAALKLRIGVLFSVVFDGWDIRGQVTGMYEGEIISQAEQNMMFYRRNIRRSV